MKKITILGSTGSIGTQALDIIRCWPDQFSVLGISGNTNTDLLYEQILEFKPRVAVVSTEQARNLLKEKLSSHPENTCDLLYGDQGLVQLASIRETDLLLSSIAGTASLLPTYHAVKNKIDIALASKEVLVSAGDLIMGMIDTNKTKIVPVDSEHAAVHQCMKGIDYNLEKLKRIILTASGGPFWNRDHSEFKSITKEEALKHPKWTMGSKITIDSSTLMNKGLEVIEAHYLFNVNYNAIDVIIHPQSTVHAFTEFIDGNLLAHLGPQDMRYPIQYAMTYPDKTIGHWPTLDIYAMKSLEFYPPDTKKFPLLDLAYTVGRKGGTAPAIMNAANEAAVNLFLEGKITYVDIFKTVSHMVESFPHQSSYTIEDILELDKEIKYKTTYERTA